MSEPSKKSRVVGGIFGAIVGDALGVPVEFMDRAAVQANPVTAMGGYGTHRQPPGTWSDDGALMLCTAESLIQHEFNLHDMGQRFIWWVDHGLWAAHGEAFDVGASTSDALIRIKNGTPASEAGNRDEFSNGNGSLMRILPVALRFADAPIEVLAQRTSEASQITHAHDRSKMACTFYSLMVRMLLRGATPAIAFAQARRSFLDLYVGSASLWRFSDLTDNNIADLHEANINSSGYVIHTLTASIWCLLTTNSFQACVLKAVNLGVDTDTTGCVAGGLAGVAYGLDSIPADWLAQLPRKGDLDHLLDQFADLIQKKKSE